MNYKFVPKKEWFWKGILLILYVLVIIFCGIYAFFTNKMGRLTDLYIIVMVIILGGMIYKSIYYFKLPQKFYLIIDGNSLSIHRGSLFPRKLILFDKVERVVKLNEAIIFLLENGKEELIDTDHLSNEDKLGLEKLLSEKLDSKTVAF